MVCRQNLRQLQFYFCRILTLRPAQPPGYSEHVGIHSHSRYPVGIGQVQCSGLPPHPGQLQKLTDTVRNLSAEFMHNLAAALFQILSLILISSH